MKFEIIKNSEGCKKWNIEDKEYLGQITGLCCGWEFEIIDKEGKLTSLSVIWDEALPEDTWEDHYYPQMCEWHGWEPTGRVVFRGYARSHWDAEERDYYVVDITDAELEEIKKAIA